MEETKPKLQNIQLFQKALSAYQVSDRAKAALQKLQFVAVSGLAGGGRNTVINYLVAHYKYAFVVSDTTRPPKLRDGAMEQAGVHYYFRSEQDVLRDIQKGEFLEAEIIHNQQVSGISIRELERLRQSDKIAITDIEFGGVNNVAKVKHDTWVIGLLPPSYEEWISRFTGREEIHEDEFMNRIRTAEKVLVNMLEKPYVKFVVNDDVAQCAETIHAIVEHDGYTPEMATQGKQLAQQILIKIQQELHQGFRNN